ncbi:hypothetical protein [Williamsia sp. CHRR-6]|nr:hypothetical protein [Williamsia sp. CHRR-6]MBT0565349.1 hypothetical protein [Williamsia sp. CHRR-6]
MEYHGLFSHSTTPEVAAEAPDGAVRTPDFSDLESAHQTMSTYPAAGSTN